jgi:hypothetical protein
MFDYNRNLLLYIWEKMTIMEMLIIFSQFFRNYEIMKKIVFE